ncbi:hypothetical protein D3C78_1968170 [compost metagenome]
MVYDFKMPQHHSEHKRCFLKSKLLSNACSLTVAEGLVGVMRHLARVLEALWTEFLYIRTPRIYIPVQLRN